MILVFDTETNGLPKNFKAPPTDLNNWPRIIQLGWALYHDDGVKIASFCNLIKPDGWTIPNEKFWIDNGYSTEKNAAEGMPIQIVLRDLAHHIDKAHTVVAHNMDFDYPIIAAEMIRYNIRPTNKPSKLCTMKASTNVCMIPGARGFKWPNLTELHTYLFGTGFDGAHDALSDVLAAARCYFELVKRGHIQQTQFSVDRASSAHR